jgi:hypothetical protein
MICLEKCKGTIDELFSRGLMDEINSASALFQIIMTLIAYQKLFHFTHNDLHTNNIVYNEKAEEICKIGADIVYMDPPYNNRQYSANYSPLNYIAYYDKNILLTGKTGLIDGYTPEQRLFISWATIWRSKIRDEALKNQVKTDPHSPGMYRAYVPLTNLDTFFQAFDIKEGDGMYVAPDKRVKIW